MTLVRRVGEWAYGNTYVTLVLTLRYVLQSKEEMGFVARREILNLLTTYRSQRVTHPICLHGNRLSRHSERRKVHSITTVF